MNKIRIGEEVPKMHQNDHEAEEFAIKGYNESIRSVVEVGDNGTRELLESILKEEGEGFNFRVKGTGRSRDAPGGALMEASCHYPVRSASVSAARNF